MDAATTCLTETPNARLSRHKETRSRRLEATAQVSHPGHEGTGVDVDAIRQNLGSIGGGVAMHDDFPKPTRAAQERLAIH